MKRRIRFNPAVRNSRTFAKKKIKVGRRLPHQNATNTTVQAKKIVLVAQISDDESDGEGQGDQVVEVIHPDHNMPAVTSAAEVCGHGQGQSSKAKAKQRKKQQSHSANLQVDIGHRMTQLAHHNEHICSAALTAVRNCLNNSPEQITKHLRKVIPAVGSLLMRELKQTTTRNQLKRLIESLCSLPASMFSAHFTLFCSYVLTGTTDIRHSVRWLAFDILTLLMRRFPELCRQNRDKIFHNFMQLFSGQRVPGKTRLKLLDSIGHFIDVFSVEPSRNVLWSRRELSLSFDRPQSQQQQFSIHLLPSPLEVFNFPVLYQNVAGDAQSESLLTNGAGLAKCCAVLCPFLTALIVHGEEAQGAANANFTSVMARAFNTISRLADLALDVLLRECSSSNVESQSRDQQLCVQLANAFVPLKKFPLVGGSKKLVQKIDKIANYKKKISR